MKHVIILLVCALGLAGCSKSDNEGDFLKLQVNGTDVKFTTVSAKWVGAITNFMSVVAADAGTNTNFNMAVFSYDFNGAKPLITNTYSENNQIYTAQTALIYNGKTYVYYSQNNVLPPNATNPFRVQLTSISTTRAKGSISGTLRFTNDLQPGVTGDTLVISGSFNLPVQPQ